MKYLFSLIFFLSLAVSAWGIEESKSSPVSNSKVIQTLKVAANRLYRQKNYAEASRIYSEIVQRDTLDAATRVNLGLCLQKLGKKDSALQINRQALQLAGHSLSGPTGSNWSNFDLRVRKSAYFNLDKLGGPMREPDSGQCETWAAFATCQQAFHVCSDVGRKRSPKGLARWSILRLALKRERALFPVEEAETHADMPHPEMRDMEEVNVDGEFESRLKWLNRDSVVTLPMGETLEMSDESCGMGCKKKEKIMSECRVLHLDPCTGVIGIACAIGPEGSDDQIIIGEYYLIPVK